jgi:hypothetical protein
VSLACVAGIGGVGSAAADDFPAITPVPVSVDATTFAFNPARWTKLAGNPIVSSVGNQAIFGLTGQDKIVSRTYAIPPRSVDCEAVIVQGGKIFDHWFWHHAEFDLDVEIMGGFQAPQNQPTSATAIEVKDLTRHTATLVAEYLNSQTVNVTTHARINLTPFSGDQIQIEFDNRGSSDLYVFTGPTYDDWRFEKWTAFDGCTNTPPA